MSELYKNKRYCPKLKSLHDSNGKELAKEIMKDVLNAELITTNEKEDQGDFSDGFWDQKYRLPDGCCVEEIKVEPEMKDAKWWGDKFSLARPFQYSTMDIPSRKEKNQSHLHIVISTCKKYAFLVTRFAMNNSGPFKTKKTKYEPEGASYYNIPTKLGRFVKKVNNRWRLIPKDSR